MIVYGYGMFFFILQTEKQDEQGQFSRPRAENILSKFCRNLRHVKQSGQDSQNGEIFRQPIHLQQLFQRPKYLYKPCKLQLHI